MQYLLWLFFKAFIFNCEQECSHTMPEECIVFKEEVPNADVVKPIQRSKIKLSWSVNKSESEIVTLWNAWVEVEWIYEGASFKICLQSILGSYFILKSNICQVDNLNKILTYIKCD